MPELIPNLWPTEFKIDVQSPFAILQVQAGLLGKVTRGILVGAVETETGKERVQHRLVVIAPAYKGYRHTLVAASHNTDLPYPAEVRAKALELKQVIDIPVMAVIGSQYQTVYPVANDDDDMQRLVRKALQSDDTRAVILALISQSNEATQSLVTAPQAGGGDPHKVLEEGGPLSSESEPTTS